MGRYSAVLNYTDCESDIFGTFYCLYFPGLCGIVQNCAFITVCAAMIRASCAIIDT